MSSSRSFLTHLLSHWRKPLATAAQDTASSAALQNSSGSVREVPRPFPYSAAKVDSFGVFRLTDLAKESRHVSLGQDGLAPIAYVCALWHSQGRRATSSLARYYDLAGIRPALASMEEWDTVSFDERQAWQSRREADEKFFFGEWGTEDQGALGAAFDDINSAPVQELCHLLYALCPPHQPIVLACPPAYADFYKSTEHKAHREALTHHYDWLLAKVSQELREAGLETDGLLVKVEGYRPALYDEFDIFAF